MVVVGTKTFVAPFYTIDTSLGPYSGKRDTYTEDFPLLLGSFNFFLLEADLLLEAYASQERYRCTISRHIISALEHAFLQSFLEFRAHRNHSASPRQGCRPS